MGPYTLSFGEVDKTRLPDVGGKNSKASWMSGAKWIRFSPYLLLFS